MLALEPSLAILAPLQLLHGITYGASHIGAMHFIHDAVPRDRAASAQALYATVSSGVAMGVACLAALVLYKTRAQIPERWPLLAIGVSFCIFETVLVKLPRFYVSGVMALAAAIALTWSGLRLDVSVALLLDFVGMLALANGSAALVRLLRQPVESGQ